MECKIIVTGMRKLYPNSRRYGARVFPWFPGIALLLAGLTGGASARPTPPAVSPQAALTLAQNDPVQLMQQVCANEIRNFYGTRQPLRYQLHKITAKSDTTKEIVETRQGGVARLIAAGGEPLNQSQRQFESDRLQKVRDNPAVEAHRRQMEKRDTERIVNLTHVLPQAFLYRYAGVADTPQGQLIRLSMTPNPRWTPPDFETRILTGVRGEVLIDARALRVVRIEGRVFRDVDFGWKLLGVLYPGGKILFEQTRTDCCGWQLSHLHLQLTGKALMLKPIRIRVEEFASGYSTTPPGWGYREAAQWLLGPEWQS